MCIGNRCEPEASAQKLLFLQLLCTSRRFLAGAVGLAGIRHCFLGLRQLSQEEKSLATGCEPVSTWLRTQALLFLQLLHTGRFLAGTASLAGLRRCFLGLRQLSRKKSPLFIFIEAFHKKKKKEEKETVCSCNRIRESVNLGQDTSAAVLAASVHQPQNPTWYCKLLFGPLPAFMEMGQIDKQEQNWCFLRGWCVRTKGGGF